MGLIQLSDFQLSLPKDAVLNPPQPKSDPTSLISFHKTYQLIITSVVVLDSSLPLPLE